MSRKEQILGFVSLCVISFVVMAGWRFFFPDSSLSFYECFFCVMLGLSIYESVKGER